MKAYREWRYSATHSLTSALDGVEWLASRPGRFTSRERAPGTYWIGGWVAPEPFLTPWWREKTSSPCREANPRTPIIQPVAQLYTVTICILWREIFSLSTNPSNWRTTPSRLSATACSIYSQLPSIRNWRSYHVVATGTRDVVLSNIGCFDM